MFSLRDFQSEKNTAVLKIRAKVLDAARFWLNQHNYTEVHGPTIIPAVGDRPGSFEVKYFDKKAYLTQGLQPYGRAFVAILGKVYTIAPTFRVEKAKTTRHLTEYWRIEVAQQCELDAVIGVQQELVAYICQRLSEESRETLRYFKRSTMDLSTMRIPFPKLTYDEAIDMLQRDGFNIFWGQKIDFESENHISLRFHQPFFIVKFPIGAETFFHKPDPEKPELTLSADLLAPEGYGEIGSGAQMIDEKEVLLEKMAEEKIEPGDQQWYMDLMKYGFGPHSGFAVGIERLIQWICKLKHIKEASAFPRLSDNVYP